MNVHYFRKEKSLCDEDEQLITETEKLKSSPTVFSESLKFKNENWNKESCDLMKIIDNILKERVFRILDNKEVFLIKKDFITT